ncbi:response regulator [Deltaproteobacteria bacterium OttesenSCG-928-M10]|nr:response regulator [Deltaproteobacteria bacterium OttesenSCG-928-M10]
MTDTVLIVDDERDISLTVGGLLGDEGYLVAQASSGPEALERIDESVPEAVILDLWMQNAEQGFDVLSRIKDEYPPSAGWKGLSGPACFPGCRSGETHWPEGGYPPAAPLGAAP